MIQNEREYAVTKKQHAMLAHSLAHMQEHPDTSLPEIVRQSDQFGIRFLMDDLEQEMAEYEKLRAGQISTLRLRSLLYELPSALSRARIARGWTHRDLANALGTSEQQVQKDEHGGYRKASLARLERVASILGVRIGGRAKLLVGDHSHHAEAPARARQRRVISVKRSRDRLAARLAGQDEIASRALPRLPEVESPNISEPSKAEAVRT